MSTVLGKLNPLAAHEAAYGSRDRPTGREACRHAQVGTLRGMGFRVDHTPRLPKSPLHVSVYWLDGDWDDAVADRFTLAFEQPKGVRDV